MEPAERISEEWSSLSGLYTAEEADFMTQLLSNGNCSVPEELYGNSNLGIPSAFWPVHESTIVSVTGINNSSSFPSNVANGSNFLCLLQGSSSSTDSSNRFPISGGNYFFNEQLTNFGSLSVGFSLGDAKFCPYRVQGNDHLIQQINKNTDEESCLDPEKGVIAGMNLHANMNSEIVISDPTEEDKSSNLLSPAKRSRSSKEVSKKKRNVKSKKNSNHASTSNDEEERSPGLQGQSSSSCCSEDDSNASQELNGGASSSLSPKGHADLKLNGKSKATKGPATDPQSVYARRRRERINERLRILQNLVPNGTKVDISTMLEEAVQYVKFLQLQIKLLSSDDLWMYAPIAYNGMNIGLGLNITPTKQP